VIGTSRPLARLSEKEWDALLFQTHKSVARTLGWQSWHVVQPQKSRRGLPDRICWRDRILYVELKSAGGKLSDDQIAVLNGLAKAGGECYLWTPADYDEAGKVLGRRWNFHPAIGLMSAASGLVDGWKPGSLWLPDGHRADATAQPSLLEGQAA
jgi:hypothetical protein